MHMIHTRGLTRHFQVKKETVEAVRGIDIDVEEGELVAFLGPNGAGKSTTLRMLTTLLKPTAGSAMVAGRDVQRDPAGVRQRLGYVGQGNGAGQDQRVRDELVTQGQIYGLKRADANQRADDLLAMLELEPMAARVTRSLSGGQRRRLDVALGLVHRPALLFLDEPSTGLDPHNRANLWEHILRLRQAYGTTIFLTTHYLDEADTMTERVLVIDHGQVIADDTPAQLKDNLAGDLITIQAGDATGAQQAAQAAGRIPGARDVCAEGATLRFRAPRGPAILPGFLLALHEAGVAVATAEIQRPTLDDVFLALTGRSLRETGNGEQA